MPRPCLRDHPPSPQTCRVCRWCADFSDMGAFYRRLWSEPEPQETGERPLFPAWEIVPGLPDPIPEPPLQPVPPRWPHDSCVIQRHRQALFRLARAEPPPPGQREGIGVLMVGGGKYWPGIVVAVRMLRDTGSRLPVQIWHRGRLEPIKPADLAGVDGVTYHDLTALTPAPRVLGGWEAKTIALLACGWERVFFLDADAYCVTDPAPLLDHLSPAEPFLFWDDMPGLPGGAVNWSIWGFAASPVPPIQGGQFAIHVRSFWRELVLAHWLNQHSDFSYAHYYGDQDSWRVALTATGGAYGRLGPAHWDEVAFVCRAAGQPFVIHRCRSKMLYPEDALMGNRECNHRLDRLHGEARAWSHWESVIASRSAPEVFERIHASGVWRSCPTPEQAKPYLDIVNGLVKLSGWRRVIDLGCGDGFLTSRLEAAEVVGVDCYPPPIHRLRQEAPGKEWLNLDIDRDRERLPAGDVALLKDVLHHWPNSLLQNFLRWCKTCRKWKWVVCIQDKKQDVDGQDCPLGGYRGLNEERLPLKGLGLIRLCDFLDKRVLLLECKPR